MIVLWVGSAAGTGAATPTPPPTATTATTTTRTGRFSQETLRIGEAHVEV